VGKDLLDRGLDGTGLNAYIGWDRIGHYRIGRDSIELGMDRIGWGRIGWIRIGEIGVDGTGLDGMRFRDIVADGTGNDRAGSYGQEGMGQDVT
jgi:hypothetical protein